jgi:hypothetical protein
MAIEDIQHRLAEIEAEKEKATTLKDMLKNALENDIPYQEAAAEQKDWGAKAKKAKEDAYAAANGDEIQEEISEINEKIKSMQELLSYELVQYYEEYKTNEFTDLNGNTRRFKVGASLVRGKGDEDTAPAPAPTAGPAVAETVPAEPAGADTTVSSEELTDE